MRRARLTALAATLVLAGGLALAACLAAPAFAGDAAEASSAKPDKVFGLDDLERALLARPLTALVFILCKIVPAIAGLVLLILAATRWYARRKGWLPPLLPVPPPTQPFGSLTSIGLTLLATVLGPVVFLGVAIVVDRSLESRILVTVLATAAASVPVAILVVARRARVRRRPALEATELGEIFGGAGAGAGPEDEQDDEEDGEDASVPPPLPPPPREPLPFWTRVGAGGLTFLMFSAVGLALGFVATLLLRSLGHEPTPQDLLRQVIRPAHAEDPWVIALFGVFVAPFAEECVFRGLFYPAVRAIGGPRVAAWVVSLVFAAVHMDLVALLPLLGLALMLAWLFERTDSLLAVTVVHALNNATTLLPVLLLRGAA